MNLPLLSLLTTIPIGCGLLLLCVGRRRPETLRVAAITSSVVILLLTLALWERFNPNLSGMQFEETYAWISALHIQYHVGCDGLTILMLVLSAIVTLIATLASSPVTPRSHLYYSLIFFLEACLFGSFTALNFVHWFTYWELSLIPAFFLIRMWGGSGRGPAATTFLVFTIAGSVAMLLSFVGLYLITGSFDFIELARVSEQGALLHPISVGAIPLFLSNHVAMLLFTGVFLGFAVKIPIVPFHTWLPAAYSEAPTPVTILLTGAMSKMGVYGLVRILLPIFALQIHQVFTPLMWLTVATVVTSSFAALAQTDIKRIFAYSSINHLGYCLLGLFALTQAPSADPVLHVQRYAAMDGAILQMFNHGLTAATIFWFIAMLESRSGGLRGIDDFGGIRKVAPIMAGLMGVALFSSLGLPGLNGFISEFLIFKGSFALSTWSTSLCVIGLLLTALFILKVIQRVFAGPLNERWVDFPDTSVSERLMLGPAIAAIFAIGLYPQIMLSTLNATVVAFIQKLHF